ncbi:MAG: hypothetical protein RLY13_798 [Actinomycetota bacterium]|jgi:hypothetical protein
MKFDLATLSRSALVGALLVALPLGAGALIPNTPLISLGQSGPASTLGAEQSTDAKMMMPNPFRYNYVAGSGLDDSTGSGHVFQLQLIGEPEPILKNVAKVLGLAGEVTEPEYSTKEYPAFVIGSQDGTGPSASIYFNGTGNWWYNNPAAYPMPECSEWATSDDDSKYCQNYLEQKPTPELMPSKSQMLKVAKQIFTATGLNVSDSDIETSISDWGSSAYASLKVGGQNSPIEWSVNWGINGQIGSVSGHSVKAVDRGAFATISAKAAVSRMSDWRYSGQLAQSIWAKYQPVSGGRVIAYDGMTVEPESSTDPAVEPSGEPAPAPSPSEITVIINKSDEAQVMIWGKQGGAWIVPGYILIGDEGWITPVFSLEDGIVELPEPVEISPMVK